MGFPKGDTRELAVKFSDQFLKVSKGLEFVQKQCIGVREIEQSDADGVAAMAKSDGDK